jgi:hypothetical protein
MNSDNEKFRRAVFAQGFAAVALFFFAHGAHAATVPAHAAVHPAVPVQMTALHHLRRA